MESNKRISFEVAKIAKMKGYLIPESRGYSNDGVLINTEDADYNYMADNTHLFRYVYEEYFFAPTISDVIDWLAGQYKITFKTEEIKTEEAQKHVVYISCYGTIVDTAVTYEKNEYDLLDFCLRVCLLYKHDWELYRQYRLHKSLANKYCRTRDEFEGEWWSNSTEQISKMIASYLMDHKDLFTKSE